MMFQKIFLFVLSVLLLTGCKNSDDMYVLSVNEDDEWTRVIEFKKQWKFSIGDDMRWAEEKFNDSEWEEINVPSPWENEGYHGYDGYAWYRLVFDVPEKLNGRTLYLFLGAVDDVDEVFLNGHRIGLTGSFPPRYETAYNSLRRYPVPPEILKFGRKNTLAVRVYDSQLGGGITGGEIGIFELNNSLHPDIVLIGEWKFTIGDSLEWKNPGYNDDSWSKIIVPGIWETQGFYDYDGFAWYRKEFEASSLLANKKLILLMGRIDDFDEVYLNGELVGSTGDMSEFPTFDELGGTWQTQRNYILNHGVVKPGKNLVAVRVLDGFKDGGIHKGPVGLISQEKYTRHWKNQKN